MADERKNAQDLIKLRDRLNQSYKDELNSINNIFNRTESRMLKEEQLLNNQRTINDLKSREVTLTAEELETLVELENEQRKLILKEEKRNKVKRVSVNLSKELLIQLKAGWQYLQQQDKIIKTTNLNLGMSGAKAASMRDSFEKSAGYVTRIGGSIADIQDIMQGFAEETGRARALSSQMVEDIATIGKGTGLGVQEATRLGAQFEYMGVNARATMDYVQGVVDTSERMGVNTTKVLKNINDNFKRLNQYTFRQGIAGFAEMATYAEKFKVSISDALNAADVAKSLEGAIDLSAQLQVMGGEFAKTDPFELLYLSRNDPAEMQKRLGDMTKGLVTFKKTITDDGKTVFEKFISPADRDRIAAVEKSMGMEAGSMVVIAQRTAEIQKLRQQMGGMGFSKEQKQAVESAYEFNTHTGKFQVKLADTMVNIKELTKEQASSFISQQVMLEERAKNAQTFNDVFKATIESLKSGLLPLLRGINKVLIPVAKFSTSITKWASEGNTWLRAGSVLLLAATAWKVAGAAMGLGRNVGRNVAGRTSAKYAASKMGTSRFGSLLNKPTNSVLPQVGKGSSGLQQQRIGIGKGAAAKGAGMKFLGAGAGIGLAAVGIGAGVMLAAKGIGELAKQMAKLDETGLEALPKTMWALAGAMTPFAIAIAIVGSSSSAGALGLLALGAATLMVGAGIGVAAMGIGEMGKGLAKMNESGGGAGKELLGVAAGVGAITLAMGGGGILGMMAFNKGLKSIVKNSEGMERIGIAFANIKAVLSGSKDDFIAVEKVVNSINNTKINSNGVFGQLANLLNKPLKVEFADNGKVALSNDITLNIDGQRFMNKTYDVNVAIQKHESLRHGKGS